jgi:hypothetical protein
MSTNQLEDYLASDEKLLLSFSAESVTQGSENTDDNASFSEMIENQDTSVYTFGATDRRVVYLNNSGAFKDIDYQHISSIESDVEEDNSDEGAGMAIGCCGGFILLGGFAGMSDDPGMGILLILVGAGILALAVKALQNADTTEKQKIKFITGDEAHQQIEVTLTPETDANVGAKLSQILREQRE